MKAIIYSLGVALLILAGCKPQPPEVIIVPPVETSRNIIDNYYFVKFSWGKSSLKDTVVIEIPDDTLGSDSAPFVWDESLDYMFASYDLKHEKIIDTTGWKADLEWDSGDEYRDLCPDDYDDFRENQLPVGYHYAPGTYIYPRGLQKYWMDLSEEGFESLYPEDIDFNPEPDENDFLANYYKNIFGLVFPWSIDSDTTAFWDIQDYMDNPSVKTGNVNWGRVGAEEWIYFPDTALMWNSDAYTGVVISFIDDQHVEWRSDGHPTFQDDSYFVIKQKILNQRDGVTYYIIEGEFSVFLYNEFGENKQARQGSFRLPIITDVALDPQPE